MLARGAFKEHYSKSEVCYETAYSVCLRSPTTQTAYVISKDAQIVKFVADV